MPTVLQENMCTTWTNQTISLDQLLRFSLEQRNLWRQLTKLGITNQRSKKGPLVRKLFSLDFCVRFFRDFESRSFEKSQKSCIPGDRDRDLKRPEKIPSEKFWKSRIGMHYFHKFEIPLKNLETTLGFYGFLTIGIFERFFENSRDFWQISGIQDFLILGIFVPGIRDFSKFRDFYLQDSGFFIFGISRGSEFFVGWDILTKSQLLFK